MRRMKLEGPILIEPVVHGDERGFFLETWRRNRWEERGVPGEFVQDNHSRSHRGVVRGMHFSTDGQAKLVRCGRGAVLDVLVDLRRGSPTFGEWEGVELDEETHRQLYIPPGFAHGFCVLSEPADLIYKLTTYYDPANESGFAWDDPDVGIEWPRDVEPIVSDRDRNAPRLRDIEASLPFEY
jgi:dTDP-4-dehydrorhamnose 3,5-epimerase